MLDAIDAGGKFINGGEATLKLTDPQQKGRNMPLEQIAPGLYAARFATTSPGVYVAETELKSQGRLVDAQSRAVAATYPVEFRVGPPDTDLLKAIAEASGGRYDPKPADLLADSDRAVPCTLFVWRYLLAVAAAIFIVDLLLNRAGAAT